MPRVLVWGCSGSGKSTFAREVCRLTGLPFISLDAHFWQPGWVESDQEVFRARMAPILAQETWVLDGNYTTALGGAQLGRATHVFFFDLPRWRCLTGVLARVVKSYGRVRPEMAPGCPERLDIAFLRYIWTFRANQRPKLLAHMRGMRADQRVETFGTRAAAMRALARIGREGLS